MTDGYRGMPPPPYALYFLQKCPISALMLTELRQGSSKSEYHVFMGVYGRILTLKHVSRA